MCDVTLRISEANIFVLAETQEIPKHTRFKDTGQVRIKPWQIDLVDIGHFTHRQRNLGIFVQEFIEEFWQQVKEIVSILLL